MLDDIQKPCPPTSEFMCFLTNFIGLYSKIKKGTPYAFFPLLCYGTFLLFTVWLQLNFSVVLCPNSVCSENMLCSLVYFQVEFTLKMDLVKRI